MAPSTAYSSSNRFSIIYGRPIDDIRQSSPERLLPKEDNAKAGSVVMIMPISLYRLGQSAIHDDMNVC